MIMFIDINTYVGHWPFRNLRYNTLAGLDKLAQKHEITHMVVSNLNGLFYKDANVANEELLEELKNYSGKTVFLPMAIVNPTYPEWEEDAREMIEAGFVGFEIAPLYHHYTLCGETVRDSYLPYRPAEAVMELAEELDIPVRICARFENFRGRGYMDTFKDLNGDDYYTLLSKYPNVSVFCTNFIPCEAGEKFGELLKTVKNIYFDAAEGDCQVGYSERNLQTVSMDQICFGSFSPFEYTEAALINMEYGAYDAVAMKVNAAKAFKFLR